MEGYNSKQKLYIFVAIAIFLTINALAIVFALPYLNKGSVKGIYTDSINDSVLISGTLETPLKIATETDISNNSDSLLIKNLSYSLFALPQSILNIQSLNLINIKSGVYYIEAREELNILKNFTVKINKDTKVIIDSDEGNFYILKGQVEVLGKVFPAGYAVNVNNPTLSGNILDKTQLLSTNKVKELNKLLASKSLFVPELNFVSKPQLELKDNLLEITTSSTSYLIEGNTTPLSHVYINSLEATVNQDGSFSQTVSLENGINNFQVNVVDEVANTLTTNIKIILQ